MAQNKNSTNLTELLLHGSCTSAAVINRWIQKIDALQQKKATYEQVLKRQLDNLDHDFELLKMQSQELSVRNAKQQYNIPLAA